jgi:2-octaprenyl-6-methoxyphenol hydroxylase
MPDAGRIETEVAVVGGGPAGFTAAVALAAAGVETALVAPAPGPDPRTTALMLGSVAALEALGVWPRCRAAAAPVRVMRIVDDTSRLLRAPEVSFSAAEIGEEAFGYNVENKDLAAALAARAAELPSLVRIDEAAEALEIGASHTTIRPAGGGVLRARLVIGADGRHSVSRAAAGIAVDAHAYPQTALALNFSHTRPHEDICTELHTESGPFTLVPRLGLQSSLVCVVDRATAEHLKALDADALAAELERRSHSILGKIAPEPERGAFPLEHVTARAFGARRVALVGEAAHVIPPIGAQGLNLGLRDAASIAECVVVAHRAGDDVGSPALLEAYERMRRADIVSRGVAVDLLNRSLLSDFLPVQGLRGFGLYLVSEIAPLRRALMREGIAPVAGAPRLMQGEAL